MTEAFVVFACTVWDTPFSFAFEFFILTAKVQRERIRSHGLSWIIQTCFGTLLPKAITLGDYYVYEVVVFSQTTILVKG